LEKRSKKLLFFFGSAPLQMPGHLQTGMTTASSSASLQTRHLLLVKLGRDLIDKDS
jgi:hypothetical protein